MRICVRDFVIATLNLSSSLSFVSLHQTQTVTYCQHFRASDLWAIGCIIYQLMTGLPPFQSQSEFLIFKKIEKLDYSFHEGFNEDAKNLVQQLLVIEPQNR